jgi:hypothetical protein
MKWTHQSVGFLLVTISTVWQPLQDAPSAFEKCRIVTSDDLIDKKAPGFAAYRVPVPLATRGAKLDLVSNPTAKMYRTVLRQEMARGPNFAGHYRVAVWGCGSSCAMFAVINLDTGRVITPEKFTYTSAVYFGIDNEKVLPGSQSESGLFGFRKDSKLLAVLGDLDEDESREGAFYFVLDAERLRLVYTTVVKKDCESLRR